MSVGPKIAKTAMDSGSETSVNFLVDLHEDMFKTILKFMTTKFEDVSGARKVDLCKLFCPYNCTVQVVAVDLDAFYRLYSTCRFFKRVLWSEMQAIAFQRRMFFASCEKMFREKLLAGGVWRDQVLMMLLGDHSVVHFSLERGKVRSTINYLFLKVKITNERMDWRNTSTTIARKLALPGPDVEQYWWFNFPLTAVQTKVVEEWLPAQLFKELLEVFFRMAREKRAKGPHEKISWV
jgi:hypothetical protein